jgi:hypothetical protein
VVPGLASRRGVEDEAVAALSASAAANSDGGAAKSLRESADIDSRPVDVSRESGEIASAPREIGRKSGDISRKSVEIARLSVVIDNAPVDNDRFADGRYEEIGKGGRCRPGDKPRDINEIGLLARIPVRGPHPAFGPASPRGEGPDELTAP